MLRTFQSNWKLLHIKCVTDLTVFFLLFFLPVLGINRRLACLTSSWEPSPLTLLALRLRLPDVLPLTTVSGVRGPPWQKSQSMSPASRQLQLSSSVVVELELGDLTCWADTVCMPRRCLAAVTLTTLTLFDIEDFTDAVSGGTSARGGVLALLMPWPALKRAWAIELSW